ncbi:MAG: CDP-diacylglycerol--serine O-phosphatidyltransferase [Rhodospirillales bacterium]|nr:CDP-diacylglycerol--serine O-phosphatidyltransferase [Rhodospirillales bacterium]
MRFDRDRPHRLRDQSLNRLIPNMLTIGALCAGLTAVHFGLQGHWERAIIALVVAGILDGLDGRIARLLNGSSRFGAELDSLSDFVSFGVAPALLLYYWTLKDLRGLGWVLALVFAVCCALRLARFNTRIDNADLPAWTGKFFTGVPAPAGAGLAITPMIATFEFGPGYVDQPAVVGAVLLAVSLLMVSQVPTFSLKRIRVPHHNVVPALLVVGLLAACLVSIPWITLLAVGAVYIASIPWSISAYGKLSRQRPTVVPDDIDTTRNTPAL